MGQASHTSQILNHLFLKGPMTRSELAEQLGIRKNTIGSVCASLVEQGLIGERDQGKKRNARIGLNPDAFLSLGIEHCVDSIRLVLLDASRRQINRTDSPLVESDQNLRVTKIISEVRSMLDGCGVQRSRIQGIGFSDFIPHNIGTGLRTKSVWMPGWGDINIKAFLERDLGLDVLVCRCTDAFAIAEHVFGSCSGDQPFCVVYLDRGIGLSVFRRGEVLTGSTDIFGEMGHTVCREGGEICKCGNRGCLETFASTGAIIRKVEEHIGKGFYFERRDEQSPVSLEDILRSAKEGNKLALLVLSEASKAIGDTIANVVNILGITRIVLYGELVKAGDLLLEQVVSSIHAHCIYPLNEDTEVMTSTLDHFASAAGAAHLVLQRSFAGKTGRASTP